MARRILYIEDNPGDVRLVQEAFSDNQMINEFRIVIDGEDAMDYLWKRGKYQEAACPDLILLDLNIPKMNGREVLSQIKKDEKLRSIPVIILSSSGAEGDIFSAYDNHANCYIQKPMNYSEYEDVVNKIEEFWLTVARLPDRVD